MEYAIILAMQEPKRPLAKWFLLLVVGIIFLSFQAQASNEPWDIKKSKHFIVYYYDLPLKYVNKLLNEGEHYYREIMSIIKNNNLAKNIKIIKKIPYSLMPKVYRTADIFILPSYSEGMPKVVLEALASRLCVITTNVEGNKDLIQNNYNGILIRPKSVSEITASLLKVIEDKNFREKLALNAWKTAQEHDWLKIAKKIQTVYESVLEK